jgi:hypothetical protein
MRADEYKEHLAASAAPPPQTRTSPPVFVAYSGLRERGIVYSRVHLRRLIARGFFPAPVQISPNRVAWRAEDLASWMQSRPSAPIADSKAAA